MSMSATAQETKARFQNMPGKLQIIDKKRPMPLDTISLKFKTLDASGFPYEKWFKTKDEIQLSVVDAVQ